MQIIIISPNKATHKHWTLTFKQLMVMSVVLLSLFVYAVFYVSQKMTTAYSQTYTSLDPNIKNSTAETNQQNTDATESEVLELYAKRLGELQAEAIRLKAITKQLANIIGVDLSPYALDAIPGLGGIEQTGTSIIGEHFDGELTELSNTFDAQLNQLYLLQTYAVTEDVIASSIPSRKPISEGWMSSYYGNRIDPFNGKPTFHHGIDFAGREGSNIVAVAYGMVSWTGKRSGYGNTVEIDHGNGYISRYAHNKSLLVNMGDKIAKGQTIALMGSTGRSTGPHVHFELLREGRTINPYSFVKN